MSPRPNVNLAVGLLLGLVIGSALALLLEALDRSVKTPQQAEDGFEAPVLTLVPRASGKEDAAASMARTPRGPASEAYRGLRTAVRFIRPDDPLRTLLVTSPSAGEGKTTTATNLAIALAQAGERVILVDADLRRGRVADALGLPGGAGLTSVITRRANLQDALQEWGGLLYVLGSGPLPPNPSEILGSESMAQVLEDLSGLADIVVIDAAPVLPVTDAVVLAAQVDGVIMVARSGRTARSSAHAARQRLDGVNAHVVGAVLNGVAASTAGYYEGYQYVPAATVGAPASTPER